MQLKVDFHTNLGFIPKTKKKVSQELYISPEVLANFLNKFEITHTVVLYSDYQELERLEELTPNTKLYGLKWINDIDDMIKNPQKLDIGKPLWAGVKFHSHRCFKIDKSTGERVYGLDYSDKTIIHKILDLLPNNSIVNMHMQGSASLQNQANPRALYTHALVYPNLKFIISHMGCYGKGSFQPIDKYFPTSTRSKLSKKHKYHLALKKIATFSEMLVWDAVYIVNRMPNCWLNTAILYPLKKEPLRATDRWGIGSDFPFTHTTPQNWDEHSYDIQFNIASNYVGKEKAEESHKKTLEWLEKDLCAMPKKKWVTFFSRTGSEILSLCDSLKIEPDIIITDKSPEKLFKLDIFKRFNRKITCISPNIRVNEYISLLEELDIIPGWDIITLHGFLKIIPGRVAHRYPMVNLHPGLITEYPELKGLHPQQRFLDNRDDYDKFGCVLHKVIAEVDEGEIIASCNTQYGDQEQDCHDEWFWDQFRWMAQRLWELYLINKLDIKCELPSAEQVELERQLLSTY